jgi:predicted DNA-binding transcriptional regulator YafY
VLDTSARLLRLLSLLQARRTWAGGELAERLEVTRRTVRRDVDRLRRLGYPVEALPGVAGGYTFGTGADLPPLLLDDEEAVAVVVGLRAASIAGVTGMAETSVRALAKVERMLPSRLRRRVDALQSAIEPMTAPGTTVDARVLVTLADTIRDHERLRADYRRHDGTQARRTLEPHRLVHTGRRWYLVAWDLERDDWRTFRVDRLTPRIPAGPRFVPRTPPDDLVLGVAHGVSTAPYRHQARVLFHAPAAEVSDHFPPTVAVVTALDDGTCELSAGGTSWEEMALWLGLAGLPFTVVEPDELRRTVGRLAEVLTAAAAGPGQGP